MWPTRALDVAERRGIDRALRKRLARIVSGYDAVVERVASMPATLVHGELYPSNVLVDNRAPGVKVWPIDWEMAGVGPALLDVAALTAGWRGPAQATLVGAYLDELGPAGAVDDTELAALLDGCRLHYALQWLGWSADWSPPPEHARDWVSEAVALGERLGL